MKKLTLPIVLSLLGMSVCGVNAQTPTAPATPAPASTPAASAPMTTPTPGGDTTTAQPTPGPLPTTYTVVSGDSLWKIAHDLGISLKSLKKANPKVKATNLKPGQVLQVPQPKATTSIANPSPVAAAAEGFLNTGNTVERGEGEVSADTDSPAPSSPDSTTKPLDTTTPASVSSPSSTAKPKVASTKTKRKKSTAHSLAHSKKAVKKTSPTSPAAPSPAVVAGGDSMTNPNSPVLGGYYHADGVHPAPVTHPVASNPAQANTATLPPAAMNSLSRQQIANAAIGAFTPPPPIPMPVPQEHKSLFGFLSHDDSSEQVSWAGRFHDAAEQLASHHISYGQSWRPPGEDRSWVMDCSNTSRYIYKMATNLNLPRTASDQYFYLHLQNRAWDVPTTANNEPDVEYLRKHLKPGDLLFWENTYRPERQPPITHVMIFLGQDAQGKWLMAGSQGGHDGEHHHSGPDIYKFDPTAPSGGYTTWIGLVHHKGRFTAFGRPLSADPAKLASS